MPFALHVSTREYKLALGCTPATVSENSQPFRLGKHFSNRNYRHPVVIEGSSGYATEGDQKRQYGPANAGPSIDRSARVRRAWSIRFP